MRIQAISAVIALTAAAAFADATVEQHTQVHFGGAAGSVINTFGGKAAREGVTGTTFVKGNRKLTRTGTRGDLVDLDAEKVYSLDFENKVYTVTTFEELRKRFAESQERMAKSASRRSGSGEKNAPEWDVEFKMKPAGKSQTINGWNTHEEIATVIVHEK